VSAPPLVPVREHRRGDVQNALSIPALRDHTFDCLPVRLFLGLLRAPRGWTGSKYPRFSPSMKRVETPSHCVAGVLISPSAGSSKTRSRLPTSSFSSTRPWRLLDEPESLEVISVRYRPFVLGIAATQRIPSARRNPISCGLIAFRSQGPKCCQDFVNCPSRPVISSPSVAAVVCVAVELEKGGQHDVLPRCQPPGRPVVMSRAPTPSVGHRVGWRL